MSAIANTGDFKPGSIYRIALENFVTYKEVELYPQPYLNMIIGPNGTGKSTFVSAIVLGLCGKAGDTGRGKEIPSFVRRGCSDTTIEIELYNFPRKKNIIITRRIDLKGCSKWFLDHVQTSEKTVQKCISEFNIQVANLCQLLPQEKVQDFSAMDPQKLLRSTLHAVNDRLVITLDELINCRKKHREKSSNLNTNKTNLTELIRQNEILDVQIQNMQLYKQMEKDFKLYEIKKHCLEYDQLRNVVGNCKRDKEQAETIIVEHKKHKDALENEISAARSNISQLERGKVAVNKEIHSLRDSIKEMAKKSLSYNYNLIDVENNLKERIESQKNRERDIVNAKMKLEKLINDKNALMQQIGSEDDIKNNMRDLQIPILKTNKAIEKQKSDRSNYQSQLESVQHEQRLYQRRINNLQDMAERKLETLRSQSEDTYKALMWLRQNRDLFEHEVHEPMILNLNFTDPRFARYLENTVANRDLIAFTFESTQDMNLFMRTIRGEHGLKRVNAINSTGQNRAYNPPYPIEKIRHLGFQTYLKDTVLGPQAILNYLCSQYHIHTIPIGDDFTFNNSEKVPESIRFFFTTNHRFTTRVSAYSGKRSSTTTEIRPAKVLANTVDVEQLNEYNEQLQSLERDAEKLKHTMSPFDDQISRLERDLEQLYLRKKDLSKCIERVNTISSQIRLQQRNVDSIEKEPAINIEFEKRKCKDEQRKYVLEQCKAQQNIIESVKTIQNKIMNSRLWQVKLDLTRGGIVGQETRIRELKDDILTQEANVQEICRKFTRAKSEAKEKLEEIKKSCKGKMPIHPDFPHREKYETLPNDLDELNKQYYDLQNRIKCMDKGDEDIIKEFEEREKRIKELQAEVNNADVIEKQIKDRIDDLRSEWLPPLERLITQINEQFSEVYVQLGCAGEVKLDIPGDENDYDKYGISIMVKFRESEHLQQFNRHTQSGGERALTTAIYLMALQRITSVPFRCVDEINQGMDAINERKIFQLLVNVTTMNKGSQYFLLTPKLLANLEYNEHITVHTIMNGKKIMNHRQWKLDNFIENAHRYRLNGQAQVNGQV